VRDPLNVGQCFDEILDPSSDPPAMGLRGVDCSEPHDAEVFFTTAFPQPPGTPYPGDQATSREADRACLAQFAGYVGKDYGLSSLRLATMRPVTSTWATGDRAVVCSLYDGSFKPLVGSMRGSGR
jgi:hypothetical protein